MKNAFAIMLGVTLAGHALALEVDGVAAQVGTETILRSDVYNEMRRQGLADGSRYVEVRNEMIERKLIAKAAQEAKMQMQDWVVENRVREIINRAFGGDRNKLVEMLGRQKISYPEWLAKLKEDMVVSAMRWNVVDKFISISPSMMREEYKAHPERYESERKVSVSVVMLKPDEKLRREELSKTVAEKGFDALGAKKYENVKPEDVFNPEICEEISKMPRGTISRWLEIDGWSFLLRKDDDVPGRKMTFAEAYDLLEANLKAQESKKAYAAWMERLRAETYVKVY
jgi:septum formation topological specificity factor MinE